MPLLAIFDHPSTLPVLTTLIGSGGLTVGVYSFINPTAAARIYGVPVSTSSATLTNILSTSSSSPTATSETAILKSRDVSYIHALGIRNFTAGLCIIALTGYWHFSLSSASPLMRLAVQRALSIVIVTGSLVPMTDAWVCWSASRNAAEALTKKRKEGNMKVGDLTSDAVEVGRNAGNLHAMRSLIWLAGGIWCLLG